MRRRAFLQAGAGLVAGLVVPTSSAGARTVEVRLLSDGQSGFVGFDPVGLLVEVGTTVRWVNTADVHTVTAYHPDNGGRPLRIPREAEPWDSGYLMEAAQTFARRFTMPGVYDYFCIPHEAAGMAGRLVVGAATGPGARPWSASGADRAVPAAVRRRLPPAAAIVERGRVPAR